jgi:glycosyltransferase involved in cell wall biosynthesis
MALRILTQVNYSAGNNPEGDSGLYFLSKLLSALVKLDKSVHFYVLIPKRHEEIWAAGLKHRRITLISTNQEPRLHGGSFMFDPADLYNSYDFLNYDIDILFLNQPETAPALSNFLNRQMYHCVPIVSYIHWFDTRPPGTPKRETYKPAILGAATGMLISDFVGVNSNFGQNQIIKHSKNWFNDTAIGKLGSKIKILPPGVDGVEMKQALKERIKRKRDKIHRIVINHRLLNYTGVRGLLTDIFPKIWNDRKDFTVHATNPSKVSLPRSITEQPWLTVTSLEKKDYLRLLGNSDIVVAPHKSTHWSISTLEAICAGCVPLMNKESFFGEMIDPVLSGMSISEANHIRKRWFYHRSRLNSNLQEIMDNLKEEKLIAAKFAKQALKIYDWPLIAKAWQSIFHEAEAKILSMPDLTPSMRRIFEMLLEDREISKQEILKRLGWWPKQRTLAWTSFRKSIKKFATEDSINAIPLFRIKPESAPYLIELINGGRVRKK